MMLTFVKPIPRPVRRRYVVKPRADIHPAVELTGKFLGLFVLFTSSMNWWHYRKIRKEHEKKK
jgi:hypothetical protein